MKPIKEINITKPGVILLGFITLTTQVILLREFLTFFNGNELVIGIILANWMLLTGLGAYFGRYIGNKKPTQRILILLGSLAFIPIITVLILHIAWHLIFPPGIMAGILHVFYYSLIILSPFCITSGILFTLFAKKESINSMLNKVGDVYAWESLGSLLGGAILNFILIWVLSVFQSLIVIMVITIVISAILSARTAHYSILASIIFIGLVVSFLCIHYDLDTEIRQLSFPGQEIKYTKDSPFGIFTITEQNEQVNYYENNILIASSGDIVSKEESVHFAMVQHQKPQYILLLSGMITGILEEITEYQVKSIDYVDINPEVIKIAKQSLDNELHSKVKLIKEDPVRFLKQNNKKYDVVLINLPKPSTIQLNRYYTLEFFSLLKQNLGKESVVSLSLPSSANYMNNEAKELISIIYKTLKSEFLHVLILPAGHDFFIASDNKLSYGIAEKIEQLNIPTEYVNTFYFDDDLLKFRGKQIQQQLDQDVALNKDFSPVFYQSQIKLWMSHFNVKYWIPALIILLFSGFFFFKTGIVNKGVFAAGFAGTTIEIILLLAFQIIYGYVYIVAGIFIMIFMGGLALGSFYLPRRINHINNLTLKYLLFFIALFALLLPLFFILFRKLYIPDAILFVFFTVLLLVISVLTGAVFSIASKIRENDFGKIASNTYGLDLLGAATGALVFTIYLIPLLGLSWSVIITGLFNLALALIMRPE